MTYSIKFIDYNRDEDGDITYERGSASMWIEATDFDSAYMLAKAIFNTSEFDDYTVEEL